MSTPTLGRTLAVLDTISWCDATAHEVRLVTDGRTAYVDAGAHTVPTVARAGVVMSAACPEHTEAGPCPGHVEWRLDTEGAWTGSERAIRLLAHGTAVEA